MNALHIGFAYTHRIAGQYITNDLQAQVKENVKFALSG